MFVSKDDRWEFLALNRNFSYASSSRHASVRMIPILVVSKEASEDKTIDELQDRFQFVEPSQ